MTDQKSDTPEDVHHFLHPENSDRCQMFRDDCLVLLALREQRHIRRDELERRGEHRVRRCLQGTLWRRYCGPNNDVIVIREQELTRPGEHWASFANEAMWWALTGEGDSPE